MKKQTLNEEITRIKQMMGKITNESFDDIDDFDDIEDLGDEEDEFASDDYLDADDDYISKDYDGFSPKLKHKQIKDRMKLDVNREPSSSYLYLSNKEEREKQRLGLPLKKDEFGQPEPYNPIKSTDIPLEKYLAIKRDKVLGGHKKLRYDLKF
jgi:hypothetical protein